MPDSRVSFLGLGRFPVARLAAMLWLSVVLAGPCWAGDLSPAGPEAQADGQAAQPKEWDVKLGAGARTSPKYEGSAAYTVSPLPYFNVTWRDTVSLGMKGLDFNLLHDQDYKFGLGLTYNLGRDGRGSNFFGTSLSGTDEKLRSLGTIDPAVGVRAFGSYTLSPVVVRASVTKFTGYQNNGTLVDMGLSLPYPVMDKLTLTPGLGTTWADDSYMRTFYGVTGDQSGRSGLPVFHASNGFKDVTAGLMATYQFDPHWSLSVDADIKRLLGDADRSPITDASTSASFSSMVGYHF